MKQEQTVQGERFQKALLIAVIAVFTAALLSPLVRVLAQSFDGGLYAAFNNYSSVLLKKRMARVVWHSFAVSGSVATISTSVAFMFAYALWLTSIPKALKTVYRTCIMAAFLFPSITYGFAVIYSFGT